MTSVVDTSVKHFTSAMVNAPVLNGVAGAMISLLDACLKDGFDLKSATSLVVSGGVATLSYSGSHSALVDSVILVAGSSIAALNGEQKVTAVSSGTVSFATETADATATGTITFKMAPLGWLKSYSGNNLAAYKSSDVTSTGCLLRVDDTGTTSARVVGYESMSAIGTGVGPFPTTAQVSGGGYWAKSSAANATGNNWVLVGDGRYFILFVAPGSGATPANIQGYTRGFGDIVAYKPGGDAYACALSYSTSSTATTQSDGGLDALGSVQQAMPRSYTALGSSALHASIPFTGSPTALSGADSTMGAFPSVVDGGLRLSKRFLATATSNAPPRGEVPGLYTVPQSGVLDVFRWGDRIPGTGTLAGRRLLSLNPTNAAITTPTSTNTGVSFADVTGPWR